MTKKEMTAAVREILVATSPHGIFIPQVPSKFMSQMKPKSISLRNKVLRELDKASFEEIVERLRIAVKYMALEIEAGQRELYTVIQELKKNNERNR